MMVQIRQYALPAVSSRGTSRLNGENAARKVTPLTAISGRVDHRARAGHRAERQPLHDANGDNRQMRAAQRSTIGGRCGISSQFAAQLIGQRTSYADGSRTQSEKVGRYAETATSGENVTFLSKSI